MDRRRLLSLNELPDDYVRLQYLQSSGLQYIDTGYVPNENTVWEFDLLLHIDTSNLRIGRHGSGQRLSIYVYSTGAELAMGGYEQRKPSLSINKMYHITLDIPKNTGTISDYGTWTFTPITWTNNQTLLLFRRNVGTYIDGDSQCRLSSHMVSENGDVIQYFIPVKRKSDDVFGMYDLCGTICPLTGTPFYINAGSGTFIGG